MKKKLMYYTTNMVLVVFLIFTLKMTAENGNICSRLVEIFSNNWIYHFINYLHNAYIVNNFYSFHKNNKKGNELNNFIIRHWYTKKHLHINFVISVAVVLEKNVLSLTFFLFFIFKAFFPFKTGHLFSPFIFYILIYDLFLWILELTQSFLKTIFKVYRYRVRQIDGWTPNIRWSNMIQ